MLRINAYVLTMRPGWRQERRWWSETLPDLWVKLAAVDQRQYGRLASFGRFSWTLSLFMPIWKPFMAWMAAWALDGFIKADESWETNTEQYHQQLAAITRSMKTTVWAMKNNEEQSRAVTNHQLIPFELKYLLELTLQ